MKKVIICLVPLFFVLLCNAQEIKLKKYSDKELIELSRLAKSVSKEMLDAYSESYSELADSVSKQLLDALPDKYNEFVRIWGYTSDSDGFLYNDVYIIDFLYQNPYVNQDILYEKMIKIGSSFEGEWQTDQVSFLKSRLSKITKRQPKYVFDRLQVLTPLQNTSFWRFLFGGPHPSNYKDLYEHILASAKKYDYQYINEIEEGFKYNLEKEECHGH